MTIPVIVGTGAAVPASITTNEDLARLGIDEEWILSRTGIARRHFLKDSDQLVDLAVVACQAALEVSGLDVNEIDFIVSATSTSDRISPGLAPEIGHALGANSPGSIDLNGACTGFLYGLDFATARIESGRSHTALVVGADAMTRLINPNDRNTAVLFGDGAGAVLVTNQEIDSPRQPAFTFGSSGEFIGALQVRRDRGYLEMQGGEIYAHAVEGMASGIRDLMNQQNLFISDIDKLVCHQANARIINSVLRELNWPIERSVSCVQDYGNTSAASIPLALAHARDQGELRNRRQLAMSAFGAGLTWGAGLIEWNVPDNEHRALVEV